jgi:hypothetical protein
MPFGRKYTLIEMYNIETFNTGHSWQNINSSEINYCPIIEKFSLFEAGVNLYS